LKKNRDTTIGSLSSAKWRDVVREARGRTARRAEAARDKRAREELDLYTNSQHQIRNAMGEIMLGEAALYRASKRMFGEPVRLYMFDEFRL
jgi:ribosome-binding ATPase YchF (GTP1/OBG family)